MSRVRSPVGRLDLNCYSTSSHPSTHIVHPTVDHVVLSLISALREEMAGTSRQRIPSLFVSPLSSSIVSPQLLRQHVVVLDLQANVASVVLLLSLHGNSQYVLHERHPSSL